MSIRKRKKKMDTTQPITNLRSDELRLAVEQMKIYTDNNPNRLTGDHVVTAFKSLIGSSRICGVPLKVPTSCGDVKSTTFRIPVKGNSLVFTSIEQIRSFF
jgi:hypothetical protein